MRYFIFLLFLPFFSACTLPDTTVPVQSGTVRIPDGENGLTSLAGQWEVYVGEALSPDDIRNRETPSYATVPPRYTRFYTPAGERLAAGVITYRLVIRGLPSSLPQAVELPRIQGSLAVWMNGRPVDLGFSRGVVPRVLVPLRPNDEGTVDLVAQIGTRFAPHAGLARTAPVLGPFPSLVRRAARSAVLNGLFVGVLITMAVFQLVVLRGSEEHSPSRHLSAILLLIALRLLLFEGEMPVVAGLGLTPALATRLRGLVIYPLYGLYGVFLRRMYPAEAPHRWITVIQRLATTWTVLSVVIPPQFWMDLRYAWGIVAVTYAGLAVVTVIRTLRNHERGARFSALALGVLLSAGPAAVMFAPRAFTPIVMVFAVGNATALAFRSIDFRLSVESLRDLAEHDGLTGLANRRSFDRAVDDEWLRHTRSLQTLSLVMVDIDNFKRYNDTLGHLEGDRVLQKVARELSRFAQRSGDLAARYGGEEFCLLLPNTEAHGAYHLAVRLRCAVRDLGIEQPGTAGSVVTISVGVASHAPASEHQHGPGPEALVQAADRALYEAKDGGRDTVRTATVE